MRLGLLMRLPVPLIEECARAAQAAAESLAGVRPTLRLHRAVASAVLLNTALAVAEGAARAVEAVEGALAPGEVANAADDQQTPGEVRAAMTPHAHVARLTGLDQRVTIAIVVSIADQPEPSEDQQADQQPAFAAVALPKSVTITVVHSRAPFINHRRCVAAF